MTAIVDSDRAAAEMLHSALGPETVILTSLEALRHHLDSNPGDDVVVLSSAVDLYSALALAESLRVSRPSLGVILLRRRVDTSVLHDALRAGVREVVDERDLHAVTTRYVEPGRSAAPSGNSRAALRPRTGVDTDGSSPSSAPRADAERPPSPPTSAWRLRRAESGRSASSISIWLWRRCCRPGLRPVRTIADAVPLADSIDGPTLSSLLTTHSAGVKTLAAPLEPGLAEQIPLIW